MTIELAQPEVNPLTCSYEEFVNLLFVKPESVAGKLAHAAVGMVGEAIELDHAVSAENELEECGDWEFYFQALMNHCPATQEVVSSSALILPPIGARASVRALVYWSNEVLDLAKKGWIYEKDLTTMPWLLATDNARTAMDSYYRYAGITQTQALAANREKLLKRYAGGRYSDAAAQARADKA